MAHKVSRIYQVTPDGRGNDVWFECVCGWKSGTMTFHPAVRDIGQFFPDVGNEVDRFHERLILKMEGQGGVPSTVRG